jgi:hypothetical protein
MGLDAACTSGECRLKGQSATSPRLNGSPRWTASAFKGSKASSAAIGFRSGQRSPTWRISLCILAARRQHL